MEIPAEIIGLMCPVEITRGVPSFDQVVTEKKLSEGVLTTDKALSILSDFGKVFFLPKIRFEFI